MRVVDSRTFCQRSTTVMSSDHSCRMGGSSVFTRCFWISLPSGGSTFSLFSTHLMSITFLPEKWWSACLLSRSFNSPNYPSAFLLWLCFLASMFMSKDYATISHPGLSPSPASGKTLLCSRHLTSRRMPSLRGDERPPSLLSNQCSAGLWPCSGSPEPHSQDCGEQGNKTKEVRFQRSYRTNLM